MFKFWNFFKKKDKVKLPPLEGIDKSIEDLFHAFIELADSKATNKVLEAQLNLQKQINELQANIKNLFECQKALADALVRSKSPFKDYEDLK